MIGLVAAIILFNVVAFTTNKRLSGNQIVHIWAFTIALQMLVDLYVDAKFHGYWYFEKAVTFRSIPAVTVLVPPANIMFLNWYPFGHTLLKQCIYLLIWVASITLYELVTLLPEPWGYFHYGWWKTWYSLIINPFLLTIVLFYYKWINFINQNKETDPN